MLIAKSITEVTERTLNLIWVMGWLLDEQLNCDVARIPHFYNAFYVYKYATSLSAAIALAERVNSGANGAVENYLSFPRSSSHKEPLEILKDAV